MKKTLKFANFVVNKKEFHASKKFKAIALKTFNDVINIVFSNNKIPKEIIHYICIAAITLFSQNYPQAYLEQCKYKIKKKKMVNFIDDELDLHSDDSDYSNFE